MRRKSTVIAAFWVVFAAFYTAQSYYYRASVGQKRTLTELLPTELIYIGLWALLSPLILYLASRYRIERANALKRVPLHIALAILFAVVQRAANDLLALALRDRPFSGKEFYQTLLGYADYGAFLYFIVLLIGHVIDYYERYRREQIHASRLEADLAAAQLETLQMQLQPHFLFNTLNSISTLVSSDPAGARRMIARLSDLLRATLKHPGAQRVPLGRELEFLDAYLAIERTRFGERLRVVQQIDPGTEQAVVPFLLLQPLVENAIRHGIAPSTEGGTVEVHARRESADLVLEVSNSAAGVAGRSEGLGVGLSNTRGRLERLYDGRHEISCREDADAGFIVRIKIPFETEPLP